jgi:hypothetical protein
LGATGGGHGTVSIKAPTVLTLESTDYPTKLIALTLTCTKFPWVRVKGAAIKALNETEQVVVLT